MVNGRTEIILYFWAILFFIQSETSFEKVINSWDYDQFSRVRKQIENKPQCQEGRITETFEKFDPVDPEYILIVLSNRILTKYCRSLSYNLGNAEDYISNCRLREGQNKYERRLDGIEGFYQFLCLNSHKGKVLKRNSDCLLTVFSNNNECVRNKDWYDDSTSKIICEECKRILRCFTIKASMSCGHEAADVFESLILRILAITVLVDCDLEIESSVKSRRNDDPIISKVNTLYLLIIFFLVILLVVLHLKK